MIKRLLSKIKKKKPNTNLSDNGERVDIWYGKKPDFNKFDMYQMSHYRRYEFASSFIKSGGITGDFACGTGYGSLMLARKSKKVIGADINNNVIAEINKRYKKKNVSFYAKNILDLEYEEYFDNIVSFETIEHFKEEDIYKLLSVFNKALKKDGIIIFSTPFMQEASEDAIKKGFHLTFDINEEVIDKWFSQNNFELCKTKYQNYKSHIIVDELEKKNFIIAIGRKK